MNPELEQFKIHITTAVQETIVKVVNGKIDAIKKDIDELKSDAGVIKNHLTNQDRIQEDHGEVLRKLDQRVRPFETATGFFVNLKTAVVWIAGLFIPVGIISGAIIWFYKLIE